MKFLLVTQYYPPETGACPPRIAGFARELVRMGHDVTVLTGFPNYPQGRWHDSYAGRVRPCLTETLEGALVRRVWLLPDTRSSAWRRLGSYGSFMTMAVGSGLGLARPDVVVGTSGPMFAATAGMALAAIWRVPFVFDVRDIWPGLICEATGMSRNAGIRALERLEMTMYRRAGAILAVTRGIVEDLESKGVSTGKITLLRNGVDTEVYRPLEVSKTQLRRKWGLPEGPTIALYAGTVGLLQSLETLLEAAWGLEGVFVLIAGEGPKRASIKEMAAGMSNVAVLPNQPEEKIVELMNAADVGVNPNTAVPINRKAMGVKSYAYMACGLPYLIGNSGECEAYNEEARAGLCVPPEDVKATREALLFFRDNPDEAAEMGRRGLAYARDHHSRPVLARKLLEVAHGLLGENCA